MPKRTLQGFMGLTDHSACVSYKAPQSESDDTGRFTRKTVCLSE